MTPRARSARNALERFAKCIAPVAVLCAVSLISPAPASAQSAPEPDEVEAQLEAVRAEIRDISDRLDARRAEAQKEQQALADAERDLARLAREMRATGTALTNTRQRIDELEGQVDVLSERIAIQRNMLAEQLRIAYRLGARSRIRTLLNAEDPTRISRQLAMHGYLGRARAAIVEELDQQQAALDGVLNEQLDQQRRLQNLDDRLQQARTRQEVARVERERALNDLAEQIRGDESRLEQRRQAAAELESLLEELAGVLSDIPPELSVPPFSELRGTLPQPLSGRLVSGFADERNRESDWQAWLIEADAGDEVGAVGYGRVAYADWLRGYGMMLIIDHGNGYMSLYGHNQALLADVGDWVQPGQVIALAGNSGGEDRDGLYFQLRHDGQPLDPAAWIQR